MNAILARYLPIAEAMAALAIVAGVAFGFHQYSEHERDIGRAEVQARWDKQEAADKDAADKQSQFWRDQYTDAINQGAKNAQALHTDAAAARAAADGLRNTNDKLDQLLAGATAEAARKYAATYRAVFEDCVGQYRAMAEAAQGHANDAATLSAAFPAASPPTSGK